MKKLTLKSFVDQSHIDPALIKAVVKQSGGIVQFRELCENLKYCSISGGFYGWIWYDETVKFFTKNKKEIRELAKNLAADFGENTYEMIRSFNCIKNDFELDEIVEVFTMSEKAIHKNDLVSLANALSWFAAEEVVRSFNDLCEE